MPGILGVINGEQPNREQEASLAAMAYPLVFTPDQEVEWFRHDWYSAGTVGYGKSFSFLKKASAYEEGVLLIMDGEVFPEAKDVPHELAASAPTIQRAEYCLYLYLHHGPEFVKRLNGNFVIGVFDNRNRTVHVYTDRFGSEPLYIWTGRGELAFATSQRSLFEYRDDVGRQYDKDAIAELIVFEKVLGNKTLFQDIRRMVPASHAVWDGRQCTIEKYWCLNVDSKPEGCSSWKDAAVELNRKLEQSMARRQADGALSGALVSGGIDSRLLLHFCSPSTIAVTFSNKAYPLSIDARQAAKVAKKLRLKHTLIERATDHYACVAELAVDVNEGLMNFLPCHSLGLHQQMLNSGIQVVLTAQWFDTFLKGYYSVEQIDEYVLRDEPSVLKARRMAWELCNSQVIRRMHNQHAAILGLSPDMKERAAVARERAIAELSVLLSEDADYRNRSEYFTLSDLQSRADIGFQRGLRTCFLDRSPAYDNDLLALAAQIPVVWKRDGRIVRWALRVASPQLARITDAGTGLPAGLCPPWSSVLENSRKAVRGAARRLSRYSKTVRSFRHPLSVCVQYSSWHNINAMLRLCEGYRSMVESTLEELDESVFDKGMLIQLLSEDLNAGTPRLKELFSVVLTFGLFDKKWGPSGSRRNTMFHNITNMKIVDLRNV